MDVVRTSGLEVAYKRVGRGPPLVFVHGAAEDGRIWQPQLDALADEFTVIAWDEPGAGRSCDVPANFGLADYANCLAAVIEALALGPAHVAGLSWGGTLAQELYRRHPRLVATLGGPGGLSDGVPVDVRQWDEMRRPAEDPLRPVRRAPRRIGCVRCLPEARRKLARRHRARPTDVARRRGAPYATRAPSSR